MTTKKGDGDFISEKVNYMAQAICNKLPENGMKEFAKLSTDQERFAFVWNLSDTHEVIVLEPEYEMKNIEKGKLHREKVTELFLISGGILYFFDVTKWWMRCLDELKHSLGLY